MSGPDRRGRLLVLGVVAVLLLGGIVVALRSSDPEPGPPSTRPSPSASPAPTPASPSASPTAPAEDAFTLATFNVLGASHTGPSGKAPELDSGAQRVPEAVGYLERHAVDVVGLQEFQRSQAEAFAKVAGDTWARFSDPDDTENSIAWRRDRFELVSGRTIAVPYFEGRERRMPYVRLRDRATGREVVVANVHNPANTRTYKRQGSIRAAAVAREVALVRRLVRSGDPVFLTGDMNDSRDVFCALTAGGLTRSASGGRGTGTCRPPADAGIDWIFGRGDFRFTGYVRDRSPRRDGTSDHPIVVTRVVF